MSTTHGVGSKVWVKDVEQSWVQAEVTSLDGDTLTVKVDGSGDQRKVKSEEAPLQNEDSRGVEVRRQQRSGRRPHGGTAC